MDSTMDEPSMKKRRTTAMESPTKPTSPTDTQQTVELTVKNHQFAPTAQPPSPTKELKALLKKAVDRNGDIPPKLDALAISAATPTHNSHTIQPLLEHKKSPSPDKLGPSVLTKNLLTRVAASDPMIAHGLKALHQKNLGTIESPALSYATLPTQAHSVLAKRKRATDDDAGRDDLTAPKLPLTISPSGKGFPDAVSPTFPYRFTSNNSAVAGTAGLFHFRKIAKPRVSRFSKLRNVVSASESSDEELQTIPEDSVLTLTPTPTPSPDVTTETVTQESSGGLSTTAEDLIAKNFEKANVEAAQAALDAGEDLPSKEDIQKIRKKLEKDNAKAAQAILDAGEDLPSIQRIRIQLSKKLKTEDAMEERQ